MDLSIGEFQEVGNTVKEFASDDATVVIGTVIDPDMTDRIRVTVVATGLGQSRANAESPMRIVRRQIAQAEPNYHGLDQPTVQRQRAVAVVALTLEILTIIDDAWYEQVGEDLVAKQMPLLHQRHNGGDVLLKLPSDDSGIRGSQKAIGVAYRQPDAPLAHVQS